MDYRHYLFDLYGTLVDIHTDEGKADFWKRVAAYYTAHGAAYHDAELRVAYKRLCDGETKRLQALYPKALIEIDLLPVFCALYTEKGVRPAPALPADTAWSFRRASTTHLRAYVGARELLEALRAAGKTVILLSNAQSCFTRPELDALGLRPALITSTFPRSRAAKSRIPASSPPRCGSCPLLRRTV